MVYWKMNPSAVVTAVLATLCWFANVGRSIPYFPIYPETQIQEPSYQYTSIEDTPLWLVGDEETRHVAPVPVDRIKSDRYIPSYLKMSPGGWRYRAGLETLLLTGHEPTMHVSNPTPQTRVNYGQQSGIFATLMPQSTQHIKNSANNVPQSEFRIVPVVYPGEGNSDERFIPQNSETKPDTGRKRVISSDHDTDRLPNIPGIRDRTSNTDERVWTGGAGGRVPLYPTVGGESDNTGTATGGSKGNGGSGGAGGTGGSGPNGGNPSGRGGAGGAGAGGGGGGGAGAGGGGAGGGTGGGAGGGGAGGGGAGGGGAGGGGAGGGAGGGGAGGGGAGGGGAGGGGAGGGGAGGGGAGGGGAGGGGAGGGGAEGGGAGGGGAGGGGGGGTGTGTPGGEAGGGDPGLKGGGTNGETGGTGGAGGGGTGGGTGGGAGGNGGPGIGGSPARPGSPGGPNPPRPTLAVLPVDRMRPAPPNHLPPPAKPEGPGGSFTIGPIVNQAMKANVSKWTVAGAVIGTVIVASALLVGGAVTGVAVHRWRQRRRQTRKPGDYQHIRMSTVSASV